MNRPSLEQDDLKAQLNAIVSPYGILFPGDQSQEEHSGEDSSPLPPPLIAPFEPTNDLCKEPSFTAAQQSVVASTEAIAESCLANDNLISAQLAPWSDALSFDIPISDEHCLEEKEDQYRTLATRHTLYSSADDKAMDDIEAAGNMDGPADWPPHRNIIIGKHLEGTKRGSKLVKGWKKFRQSLRHQNNTITTNNNITKTTSAGALVTKNIYGSRSSITEDRQGSGFPAVSSSELGGRKTVSDMDNPLEAGNVGGTLEFRKGFQSGLGARFRSGSLKGFLLKGSSVASSLSELETSDMSSIDMSVGRDSDDSSLQGGAVVVDVETIMSLGKMRQYSRGDLSKQQRLQQHHPGKSPLAQSAELESESTSVTDNLGCATYNASFDVDEQPLLVGPDFKLQDVQLHGTAKELPIHSQGEDDLEKSMTDSQAAYDESGQDGLLDTQSETLLATITHGPTVSPESISSPHWRLSMEGEPNVFGTIRERKRSEVCSNGHYLRHLMSDVNDVEDVAFETSSPEESGRQDKVFKVPLHQSVQIASAMFENGSKIPLALYYVSHELRVRGEMSNAINELFPDFWDDQDEAFEALIKVLDNRPFGQDLDLAMVASVQQSTLHGCSSQGSSGSMDGLVQSLGMETGSSRWEGHGSAVSGDGHQGTLPKKHAVSVTSKDLSRVILRFLSDLPEPLIPEGVFTTFSAVAHLQTLDSIKIQASSLLVQLLAPEQRQLLQFLLEFLDDYMLKPLREDIQYLKCQSALESTLDSIMSEQRRDLCDYLVVKYDESIERLSRIFGTVCTHVTRPTTTSVAGTSRATNQSQNSLYRHYKKEFEQKAIQEQTATATRHAQAVFRTLLTYRANIFGPSSFLSLEAVAQENGFQDQQNDIDQGIDKGIGQSQDLDQVFESDLDANYGYQSDSALYDPPIRRQSRKRRSKPSWGSCVNQRFFKSDGLEQPLEQRASGNEVREIPLSITTTRSNDCDQDCIQKEAGSDTICDSAVEVTSNVDLVALTAMREHMARSLRSNRHLPHPSVATLHSIMAETDSVFGSKTTFRKSSSQAEHDRQPDTSTREETEWRDDSNDGTEVETRRAYDGDDDELGIDSREPGCELGFKDRLQEPIDRLYGEQEMKMVEKEILKSEITTKFLTANMAGLYPSSAPVPIPLTILPSVRPLLVHQEKDLRAEVTAFQSELNQSDGITSSLSSRNRELMLGPQEKIQIPIDHCGSEDCSCSYCTTLIKPSMVPVMSRTEYELAELQSQCDSKDQHIAELLKTVQGLQGQVNVLNAKLIFLHDHHTTRPMRRRTLARNSYPVHSSTAANGRADYSNELHHHHHHRQHQLLPPCLSDDSSTDTKDLNAISTEDISLADMQELPAASFPDGILPWNNNTLVGRDCASDVPSLEEDEAMSFPDLDNNNNISRAHAMQHAQHARSQCLPGPTAVLGDGHKANVMYRSMKGPRDYHPYESEIERVLRDMDEAEEESEREGEDVLDEYYYMDAYKTMDQQLYRRPILPFYICLQ
ncbi:hypothetical protein BGZ58_006955 [Dissophora ornata]|nr:hypothetical protein BGZ58_006955 [Dissophora ornata]